MYKKWITTIIFSILIIISIVYVSDSSIKGLERTHSDSLINQTYYSTSTITNTTTNTVVETTGPLVGRGPLLVVYDVELFLEENDIVEIETSKGARIHINPNLEEINRQDWTRTYIVHNSGNYKIRVTTGHGSERLHVNIYRIITKTYYITSMLKNTSPTYTKNLSSTHKSTTDFSKTETMINFTSETTTTDIIEVIPGYDTEIIMYGMLCGIIIILITRKCTLKLHKKNFDANIYTSNMKKQRDPPDFYAMEQ